jgi:hypothetical protein
LKVIGFLIFLMFNYFNTNLFEGFEYEHEMHTPANESKTTLHNFTKSANLIIHKK